jgi:hypothetical protein
MKCKWTHITDSRGYTEPDVRSFEHLANGDELETSSISYLENEAS